MTTGTTLPAYQFLHRGDDSERVFDEATGTFRWEGKCNIDGSKAAGDDQSCHRAGPQPP